ncbi:MAG TPA: hypothetical protein VM577_16805 [Anaerovoracaceae bacterium]|nr:hypothetical protein [Anaerovoracaceae bacterium]
MDDYDEDTQSSIPENLREFVGHAGSVPLDEDNTIEQQTRKDIKPIHILDAAESARFAHVYLLGLDQAHVIPAYIELNVQIAKTALERYGDYDPKTADLAYLDFARHEREAITHHLSEQLKQRGSVTEEQVQEARNVVAGRKDLSEEKARVTPKIKL